MHLVDTHGRFSWVGGLTLLNPDAVTPAERVVEGGNGGSSRTVLGVLGKGVCLEDYLAGLGGDGEFIQLTRLDARNEALVNAGGL